MSNPTTGDAPASCAANAGQKLPSREELIARLTARAEEVQKQNPSADLKLEQKWWVPSVDFGLFLQVRDSPLLFRCGRCTRGHTLNEVQDALPQEINARFNAIIAKLIQDKFAPETLSEAHQQSRELLQAEYPQVLERAEEMLFKHEAQFAEVHRYLQGVGGASGES